LGVLPCYHAKLRFNLLQYTIAFQATMYAINTFALNNLYTNYKNRNICILSDSQVAIKRLGNHQITSKLVWGCHQSLIQPAKHNKVQLKWVPGLEGIVGNETAYHFSRKGSEHPFIGPEPSCCSSTGVAKKVVRDWKNRINKNIGNL
jgi:ribonuclease HI